MFVRRWCLRNELKIAVFLYIWWEWKKVAACFFWHVVYIRFVLELHTHNKRSFVTHCDAKVFGHHHTHATSLNVLFVSLHRHRFMLAFLSFYTYIRFAQSEAWQYRHAKHHSIFHLLNSLGRVSYLVALCRFMLGFWWFIRNKFVNAALFLL